MRLVFLGPPGAGKGTHAARAAERWGVAHISTGDLFRAEAKRDSALGRKLAGYMQQGVLVPDALVIELVAAHLGDAAAQRGFILDGFPRTVSQAEALDEALAAKRLPIDVAVQFDTSEAVVVRRLSGRRICRSCGANYNVDTLRPQTAGSCDKCGGELYQRSDDLPETVRKRLEVYQRESAPVVAYYAARGLLRTVNGDVELAAMTEILDRLVTSERLLSSAP